MKTFVKIIVTAALFLAEAQTGSAKKMIKGGGRVIGGQAADQNKYKFIVNIAAQEGENWDTLGTGSILSKTVILTACHCIVDDRPTRIKAGVADVTESSSNMQVIATKGSEKHPNCTFDQFYHYDVGVYFLAEELKFTSAVQPLKVTKDRSTALEELNKMAYNVATCYVAGWGVTAEPDSGATPSPTLQQATLTLVENELCGSVLCDDPANFQGDQTCYHQTAEWLTKLHEICAFDARDDPKTATCDGDSGAPLVCNDKVFGILSRANCQPVSPSVFMDIHTILDFVDKYAEGQS